MTDLIFPGSRYNLNTLRFPNPIGLRVKILGASPEVFDQTTRGRGRPHSSSLEPQRPRCGFSMPPALRSSITR